MAAELQALSQLWKTFDLRRLLEELDAAAAELLLRQSESDSSRKKLVEQCRDFKKNAREEIWNSIAPILKSFQTEVDSLSRRSRAAEADFLKVYKRLIDMPDPTLALERAQLLLQPERRVADTNVLGAGVQNLSAAALHSLGSNRAATCSDLCSRGQPDGCLVGDSSSSAFRKPTRDCESRTKKCATSNLSSKLDEAVAAAQGGEAVWGYGDHGENKEPVSSSMGKLAVAEHTLAIMKNALERAQAEIQDMKSKCTGVTCSSPRYEDTDASQSYVQRIHHESAQERVMLSPQPSYQPYRRSGMAPSHQSALVQRIPSNSIKNAFTSSQQHGFEDSSCCPSADLPGTGATEPSEGSNRLRDLSRCDHESGRNAALSTSQPLLPQGKTAAADIRSHENRVAAFGQPSQCNRLQRTSGSFNGAGSLAEQSDMSIRAKSSWAGQTTDSVDSLSSDEDCSKSSDGGAGSSSFANAPGCHSGTGCADEESSCSKPLYFMSSSFATSVGSRMQEHGGPSNTAADTGCPGSSRHDLSKETLDTADVSSKVKEILSNNSIGQRLFAKQVLGLSQGTVSELLSKPKHWDKLTEKGRESYRKMYQWLSNEHNVDTLKSLSPRRSTGPMTSARFDAVNTDERISQILREAQTAMQTRRLEEQSLQVSCTELSSTISKLPPKPETNASSIQQPSSSAAMTDILSEEAMVSRIYEEELLKLASQAGRSGNTTDYGLYQAELRRLAEKRWPNGDASHSVSSASHPEDESTAQRDDGKQPSVTAPTDAQHVGNIPARLDGPSEGWDHKLPRSRVKDEPCDESSSSRCGQSPPPLDSGGNSMLPAPQDEPVDFTIDRSQLEQQRRQQFLKDHAEPSAQQQFPWQGTVPLSQQALQCLARDDGCRGGIDDEDGISAASPLHKMQSVAHLFLSSSQAHLLTAAQKPLRVVLPPITQEQLDKYSSMCTEDLVARVKKVLSDYSISQRLFGESVLGLSQGSVSDLLARPKPWSMLTQKGREPFIRMHIFVDDPLAVKRLVTNQCQTQPAEKLLLPPVVRPTASATDTPVRQPSRSSSLCGSHSALLVSQGISYIQHHGESVGAHANGSWRPLVRTPLVASQPVTKVEYSMASSVQCLDTLAITSRVKDVLCYHGIGQKLFGETVLGLSQGSVSDMLSKPKPWELLSVKGREPFVKMHYWLSDPYNIERLQALQAELKASRKTGSMDDSSSDRSSPCIKKARYSFTDEQKHILRTIFTRDPYPTSASIDTLAQRMGLSTKTVINWFHNHRMRSKQQLRDEDQHRDDSNDIMLTKPNRPTRRGPCETTGVPRMASQDAWHPTYELSRCSRASESPRYSGDSNDDECATDRHAPSDMGGNNVSSSITADTQDSPAGCQQLTGTSSSSRKRKSSHPQYVHQGRELDHCADELASSDAAISTEPVHPHLESFQLAVPVSGSVHGPDATVPPATMEEPTTDSISAARKEKLDFIAKMERLTKSNEVDWDEVPDRNENIQRLERNLSRAGRAADIREEWDF